MADPVVPPVPAPVIAETDNATIRAMRAEIDAMKAQAKEAIDARAAAEAQLKERERADMDEKTRILAERDDALKAAADAAKLRDEHGRFQSEFEAIYNNRLAAVPEEKRALVQQVSGSGDWPSRVKAIDAAIGLMGLAPAPPAIAGTVTQPGGGAPLASSPETPRPLTPTELRSTSLKSIMDGRRTEQGIKP